MMNLKQALLALPETDKNVVVVLSGGMDSTILTYLLVEKYGNEKVRALSYDYNQKQSLELTRAHQTCLYLRIPHKVIDLSILGEIAKGVSANIGGSDIEMPTINKILGDPQPKTYVPFRNMILNSIAFSYAESVDGAYIYSGLQATDQYGYWDTTEDFVRAMNNVAIQNRKHKIQLVSPFSRMSKFNELEIAKELGNVKLEYTLTCYNPNELGESCGKCPSCSERLRAFEQAKMKDPGPYVQHSSQLR